MFCLAAAGAPHCISGPACPGVRHAQAWLAIAMTVHNYGHNAPKYSGMPAGRLVFGLEKEVYVGCLD